MTIMNYRVYKGQNCETTTIGALLRHNGFELSEPMIFGLAEGLGFIFWNMKGMNLPFIGGRTKQDNIRKNLEQHIGLRFDTRETTSAVKAWKNIEEGIGRGKPVGLKLDSYYLEYFSHPIHFAAHYVSLFGYSDERVYLNDTDQQGSCVETSRLSLEKARLARGPMSSRALSFTLEYTPSPEVIFSAIPGSVRANTEAYLKAPISNMGARGIRKLASDIPDWLERAPDPKADLILASDLMNKAGTGGALFRRMYMNFLRESA